MDEKCEAIDAKVSALEKQKDAYARLKKSIINRAVTHGLNNDVEFKDSGVDWIGKIPKNWNLRRIKELGTMGAGSTPKSGNDKYYDDGTHPWLNTGDVQNCIISSPQNFITDLAVSECNLKYFTSGSVLVWWWHYW